MQSKSSDTACSGLQFGAARTLYPHLFELYVLHSIWPKSNLGVLYGMVLRTGPERIAMPGFSDCRSAPRAPDSPRHIAYGLVK